MVGFGAGLFLSSTHGFAEGFDLYDETSIAKGGLLDAHGGAVSSHIVALVSRWLEEWNSVGRRDSLLLFVHMWDTHDDFVPPPPCDTLFDSDHRGAAE